MKIENRKNGYVALGFFIAFILWTVAIQIVDVRAIGPQDSSVGFATVNAFVHNLTGVHIHLYTVTDWLGLVPVGFAAGFAVLGLVQWIKRKHLLKVDHSLLVLGGFYVAVLIAYLVFERCVVNYRPILINGYLEASYPSSTTMLVLCVMSTAVMQINGRIRNGIFRRCVVTATVVFAAFMVIGRLVSGVHWFTDIVGGALLSAGLVKMYQIAVEMKKSS